MLPYSLYRQIPHTIWQTARFGVLKECDELASTGITTLLESASLHIKPDLANPGVLNPLALLTLMHRLWEKQPGVIVELGAGTSTMCLAAHAWRCQTTLGQAPHIFCVEHDLQWVNVTRERLQAAHLEHFVTIIHAPLEQQYLCNLSCIAYAHEALEKRIPPYSVECLLIDGPPGYAPTQPGRLGCLPLFATLLKTGSDVILDDARRDGETRALQIWQTTFPQAIRGLCGWITTDGQVSFRWEMAPHTTDSATWRER